MENIIAIGAGLALRAVIDVLTDHDHRLTSTLIGLWEGIVLSHFLQKDPRNSNDAYLALATRFAIDFMLTSSVVRFALTGVWTVVGLLIADIAPTVWRNTGLRRAYRALRKDVKAMRRAVPQWRIENDIRVPNISITNHLFSRPPPSTIVSSTQAAPPTSPAPILDRRPPLGTPASQVASSDINSLTREVLPGPSPALISTANDPLLFNPDPESHRTFLFSNRDSYGPDPSRLNPILIPDDDRVHIAPPADPDEQVQSQDPELSALDISPPVPEVEVITTILEIISPTPVTNIRTLPIIPDIDISVPAHQVPLPPSRPASRVNTADAGRWRGNVRALAERFGSDISPEFGKAYHQRSTSIGVLGQGHRSDNRLGSTGHQRIESSLPSRRENSMLRPSDTLVRRRGMVEPVGDGGARTSDAPGTESFIGGFVVPADRQTLLSQCSGAPDARCGGDGMLASSALGLTTPHPPSKAPTPPPKPNSAAPAPLKPPTPAPQAQLTTPASQLKSDNAGRPSKTPTSVPSSKTSTPKPRSGCATPDPTCATNRTTDYNPAEPIRPMVRSPSTVHDSIFGGAARHAYTSGDLDTTEYNIEHTPPPEYESPLNAHGEGFGGEGSGEGAVTEGRAEGKRKEKDTEGDTQQTVTDKNVGEAGLVVQKAGEGEQGKGEASKGTGGYTQGAGEPEDTVKLEERAQEKLGDNQEGKQDEMKNDEGAGDDILERTRGTVMQFRDKGATVAGGDAKVADTSTKPTPMPLTPEQTEAETHRAAFLSDVILRLQASKKPDLPQIQARVDVLKGRIAKTNFTDPPDNPPLATELPASGPGVPKTTLDQLTKMIVDLLIERQDAGPIQVKVSPSKSKQKEVEKALRDFIAGTGFSITVDGPTIVITV